MAFRKRNVGLSRSEDSFQAPSTLSQEQSVQLPSGTRASPIDGRLTTSTGTPSLDNILAGHGGLALGTCLLIEENGTTDASGALMKFYAAEGLVQGHCVLAAGISPAWQRELPGVIGAAEDRSSAASIKVDKQKMKIAWRYEKLGDFENGGASAAGSRANPAGASKSRLTAEEAQQPFCHTFDLAKRLQIPPNAGVEIFSLSSDPRVSPFAQTIASLSRALQTSSPHTLHRLVIPTLLSPAIYPPHASQPQHLLRFLHDIRSLLRQYHTKFTAMISIPLELYSRLSSLVRWAEILSDGVLELTPFPHSADDEATSGAATREEEKPQGMAKLHKMPMYHERGGGGGASQRTIGEDLAYVVSRRKFMIKPFNLGPAGGDREAQKERTGDNSMPDKGELEF